MIGRNHFLKRENSTLTNKETYKAKFLGYAKNNLSEFYRGITPWQVSESGHDDSLLYFTNHFERFWAMICLAKEHIGKPKSLCEIGSFYPYVCMYWSGKIDLYDIVPIICPSALPYNTQQVTLYPFNICTEDFPLNKHYDFITLSEVLEHLPVNLFEIEKKVIDVLAPGGYILVTYPIQYQNHTFGYEKVMGDPNKMYGEHLREFTPETTKLFFKKLTKIDSVTMSYPAYGKTILTLYQKA